MHSIFVHLTTADVGALEKVIRTLAIYGFILVAFRVFGRRELSQLNQFDFVVLLLLSNSVQNAIIGNDTSLTGGMLGALTLLLANYAVVRFLSRHARIDAIVEGSTDYLIEDGVVKETALARAFITRPQLEAAARRQGIEDLEDVECARLEVNGAVTFVARKPTDDEMRHREILDRLTALERAVAAKG
jgi:uncharacterized membrane protein YcaP (DUF421 family)